MRVARNKVRRPSTSGFTSGFVSELEEQYESGQLDQLKESILPFLKANRDKLIQFTERFQEIEGPCPLEMIIKVFIIQMNMPFDLEHYLSKQSQCIKDQIHDANPLARQKKVAEWIKENAASHRSTSMYQQVFCFEKLKHKLVPILRKELGLEYLCK